MKFRANIQMKLILLLLVFGLLPLAAVMPIVLGSLSNLKSSTFNAERSVAAAIGDTVDRNLFERYGDAQAFALNRAVLNPEYWYVQGDTPLQSAINGYMTGYGLYKTMLVLDLQGRVMAMNTVSGKGEPVETAAIRRMDFSKEKWFLDAKNKTFMKSDILNGTAVGEAAQQDVVAAMYSGEDGITIPYSAPIYDTAGNMIGVWANFADFGLVEDIVKTIYQEHKGENPAMRIAILDKTGKMLLSYAPMVAGNEELSRAGIATRTFKDIGLPSAGQTLVGKKEGMEVVAADGGEPMAVTWERTDGAMGYPGLDWTIVLYQSEATLFDNIFKTHHTLMLVCAGAVVVLLLGGMGASIFASRPIKQIAKEIDTLADGNYNVQISSTKRGDEIGDVAKSMVKLRYSVEKNMDYVGQIKAIGKQQAIIEFGLDGTILDANENFLKTTGYAIEEIKGKHHSMFVPAADRDSAAYKAHWESMAKGHSEAGEYKRVAKGGGEIWIRASYNPIFDLNGKAFKVVKYATDITKEKEAIVKINELIATTSHGTLDQRIDTSKFEGFYGDMTRSMNGLVDAVATPINAAVETLEGFSKGDLTKRMNGSYQGAFASMQKALNHSIEHLAGMVKGIMDAAQSVNAAASEIAAGSSDLSMRTEQQASSLEETAASMEQITGTVKQNSSNATTANALAATANDNASRGGEVVGQAVDAMNAIEKSSQKISDIISVIDEIAFQTNLLALNAAVEAARAGEAGKGFAVVASEVRALAGRSSTASKEIKTLISESATQVKKGATLVNQAGATLRDIVASVKQVAGIISDIASASEQQASGIGEINSAVSQMDEVTQQNAALVEENTAAAQSMVEQARALEKLIAFFQLEESNMRASDAATDSGSSSGGDYGDPEDVHEPIVKPVIKKPQGKANGVAHNAKPMIIAAPAGSSQHEGWEEF